MSKKNFKGTGADLFFSDSLLPANEENLPEIKINKTFKELIPTLSTEEYRQLEENLIQNGIRESISLWNGTIVDGHNRYEIAQKHNLPFKTTDYTFETENDAILWIVKNQFGRRNLSAYDRSVLALRLKPIISEKAKLNQSNYIKNVHEVDIYEESHFHKLNIGNNADSQLLQNSAKANSADFANSKNKKNEQNFSDFNNFAKVIDTREELAKIAGVSHDTIAKVEKIENLAPLELKEKLKHDDISINKAFQYIKKQEKSKISNIYPENSILNQNKTYNVIYSDCPWTLVFHNFNIKGTKKQRKTISYSELKTLSLPTDDDAILFMWTKPQFLDKSMQLIHSWGFNYQANMIWDKCQNNVKQWFSEQHEILLIGVKGEFDILSKEVKFPSIYKERPKKYQLKPLHYYNLIEAIFPDGRYLELFAEKSHNDKWDVLYKQILFGERIDKFENNI